jgi:cytochrome c oxidase assembly protein subunit 11
MQDQRPKHAGVVRRLLLATALMFCFGFLLVPLYDVFCDLTGLNGKINSDSSGLSANPQTLDVSRSVRVQFISINNEGMPWLFKPAASALELHPGEVMRTHYLAYNPTSQPMIAQAIPSVSPAEAADYFHKINCFCFDKQPLQSQESSQMPLVFSVDSKLPKHIQTITLSYTLFDITPQQPVQAMDVTEDRRVSL